MVITMEMEAGEIIREFQGRGDDQTDVIIMVATIRVGPRSSTPTRRVALDIARRGLRWIRCRIVIIERTVASRDGEEAIAEYASIDVNSILTMHHIRLNQGFEILLVGD